MSRWALLLLFTGCCALTATAQDDVASVRDKTFRLEPSPRHLRYKLIAAKKLPEPPEQGWGLLVVMPGGDGSADFTPFVKRIYQYALPEGYLVIQPLAPKWTSKQQIVWPVTSNPAPKMEVGVDEFIRMAVDDVAARTHIDPTRVFALAWSSGGPAAYAATLADDSPLRGAMVAMIVFNPRWLPPLENAEGKGYFLWHSREDKVCPFRMAEDARVRLSESGASTVLETYAGGHGWRVDPFGAIRSGVTWLEVQSANTDAEIAESTITASDP